jgi:hypothetical protein
MTNPAPSLTHTAEHIGTESVGSAGGRRWGRRRRWLLVGAAVVVITAVVVVGVTDPFKTSAPSKTGVTDNADPTSLATVTRQDLTSQTQVSATLGYAGSYTVVNQSGGGAATSSSANQSSGGSSGGGSSGTFTSVPAVGQLVSQGQVLYQVNGQPVVLLYGSTPAYRALSEGMTGTDVTELNADLVALGYATSSELSPTSDYFSSETAYALKKFQVTLGVTETGTLALGQAVFLPTAALVTSITATLGGPAQSGATVLAATSTARQVNISLDASQQSEIKAGDRVTITLPNNQTTPGVIASVGTVATTASSNSSSGSSGSGGSGSSNPTITVLVTPTDPAATGSWDQAPVNVTITTATVSHALVAPVNALVALSGGGYSVEVVGTDGIHRLLPVSLGLFDDADGLVQVTGSGLAAGQRVVVPGS